jgi:hypothetical protein
MTDRAAAVVRDESAARDAGTGAISRMIFQAMDRPELRVPFKRAQGARVSGRIETDTQRGMLSRISRKRNLRSKI